MKFFKRALSLTLAAAGFAVFAACGDNSPSNSSGNNGNSASSSEVNTEPSIIGTPSAQFFIDSPKDIEFNVKMNNGTFVSFKQGSTELQRNTDFKFNIGTEILTIKQEYLSKLDAGEYTFTFTTSGGNCNIVITVNGEQTQGYDMQFALPNTNPNSDHIFAKATRSDTAVTFDFITFGDFSRDGSYLEFINILFDLPELNNQQANWKFNSEDINVRVYSDGSVIYRDDFDGTVTLPGKPGPGVDNIWWKTDRTTPNYKTLDDVTITRENGVTKFSISLTYDFLGIEVNDAFRFNLSECSDNSAVDFALYENGILTVDDKALEDPVYCTHWATLDANGEVLRPEEVDEVEKPDNSGLKFAEAKTAVNADIFQSKVTKEANGIKFSFETKGDFSEDNACLEFINIFFDKSCVNDDINWNLFEGDTNIRIYSDGSVVYRNDFSNTEILPGKDKPTQDNIWWKINRTQPNYKTLDDVTITRENGLTSFSITLTNEFLGITDNTKSFRFLMRECSDNSGSDFALYGGNMTLNGVVVPADADSSTWAVFDLKAETIEIPGSAAVAADEANLRFAEDLFADVITSTIERVTGGVKFTFETEGNFDKNGNNLEFVNIYLDMPELRDDDLNWNFFAEDLNVRIYSDGKVVYRKDFDGTAENLWWKIDRETPNYQALPDVTIIRENGVTKFSITLSDDLLGITETTKSFRFQLRECADNDVNFNLYGGYTSYNGTAYKSDARCQDWASYSLESGEITLPA